MFNALTNAYNNAATNVGLLTLEDGTEISKNKQPLRIIPCGQAFQNARATTMFYSTFNDGKTPKLNRDGYHASFIHGRYLLGAVWYEAITGRNISANTYNPGATTDELNVLKQAAHDAVIQFGWQVTQ